VRLAFTLLVALLAVGLLPTVSGCGGTDEDDGDSLEGTEWTLVSGVESPPDAVLTLGFGRKDAGGWSGCNSFSVDYELDGDSITIGEEFTSTLAGCEDGELDTAEDTYRSIFADVEGWAIEDGELILSSDGDEVLRYAAATGR
jgi:heat shock protein HslJ